MEISEVNPLTAHLGYWLRFVSNHVSYAFRRKLEAEGVTVAEWVVLRELLCTGQTVPSAVADRLGMTRGAISKLVDRLVEKGLVERTASETDRRSHWIALTPAGSALVPRLAQLADENDAEFFGHLDAEQRGQLLEILQELVVHHGLKTIPID